MGRWRACTTATCAKFSERRQNRTKGNPDVEMAQAGSRRQIADSIAAHAASIGGPARSASAAI